MYRRKVAGMKWEAGLTQRRSAFMQRYGVKECKRQGRVFGDHPSTWYIPGARRKLYLCQPYAAAVTDEWVADLRCRCSAQGLSYRILPATHPAGFWNPPYCIPIVVWKACDPFPLEDSLGEWFRRAMGSAP